jgi:para-nitrobenzyl esterase
MLGDRNSSGISRRVFITGAAGAALTAWKPSGLLRAFGGAAGPIVKTANGTVQGAVDHAGMLVFKGVPYAGPTGGDNRFRPPAAVLPSTGVRDATAFGPICPQNDDDKMGMYAAFRQDEDCLNLNIWTPAADNAKRPVLVFMHGGGFSTGTGGSSLYEGSSLAKSQDIVVVTINYRLGILGWPPFQIYGPEVTNNLGLADCIAALKWIRENIGAFGGDPHNVTQSGQSAGAMLSAALGTVAQAKGLFDRAVPISMQTLVASDPERQARNTSKVLSQLGLPSSDLAKLKSLPVADLLKAQKTVRDAGVAAPAMADQLRWPFMFNIDGVFFKEDPCDVIKHGGYADVPTMIGSTTEELVIVPVQINANPTAKARAMKAMALPALKAEVGAERAQKIWDAYAAEMPNAPETEISGMIGTDWSYRVPAIRIAEAEAKHDRAWMYAFAYQGKGPYFTNAHHALDLPFWFGTLVYPKAAALFLGHDANEKELELSNAMQRALGSFARNGRPDWPAYNLKSRETMIFNLASKVASNPRSDARKLWDGIVA